MAIFVVTTGADSLKLQTPVFSMVQSNVTIAYTTILLPGRERRKRKKIFCLR
jgi:hypothetical protein